MRIKWSINIKVINARLGKLSEQQNYSLADDFKYAKQKNKQKEKPEVHRIL
jgi:hypothetical protein